ncbi:hypothetical protein BJY04DRAFT_150717 [Aspergillus karnatakaensis]|uniref:uncharacterized protein n=1 Tax=Aspergillus karnatakaensis TaxID=1810916 RepID=UPI003CCDCEFD
MAALRHFLTSLLDVCRARQLTSVQVRRVEGKTTSLELVKCLSRLRWQTRDAKMTLSEKPFGEIRSTLYRSGEILETNPTINCPVETSSPFSDDDLLSGNQRLVRCIIQAAMALNEQVSADLRALSFLSFNLLWFQGAVSPGLNGCLLCLQI